MRSLRNGIKGLCAASRPAKWRILVSVLIGLVRVAASMSFVWISKRLVDIATGATDAPLAPAAVIMAAIVLVQLAGAVAASYWGNLNIVKTRCGLKYKVSGRVLRSEWNGREEFHSGDVTNRMQEDIRVVTDLVCSNLPDAVVTVCQLAAASVYMLNLAPGLLWVLVLLMAVAILGSKLFFRTIRRLSSRIRELDSKSQQHIQESVQNRVVVLTLIGVENVLKKLNVIQDDLQDTTVSRLNYSAVARGFLGFGFMAGYFAAFMWGVTGIKSGAVTYGMMTAFLQLVGQVQRPMADLSHHIPAFIEALTSEERLAEMLSLPEAPGLEGDFCESAPSIVFENVTYSYPGQEKPVYTDFSHTFKAGTVTTVMGPTGIGKSTLIRLAMGLLKPQNGSISVYPMCNYMYVPQGNSLLSGTVRENLLVAAPNAAEEEMVQALRTAAAEFVLDLPMGLDTVCGEEGTGLSEGQAQRIAIARAILHKGSILILDEATSALDSETEKRLVGNLSMAFRGRKTIIMITHRDSLSGIADDILRIG